MLKHRVTTLMPDHIYESLRKSENMSYTINRAVLQYTQRMVSAGWREWYRQNENKLLDMEIKDIVKLTWNKALEEK